MRLFFAATVVSLVLASSLMAQTAAPVDAQSMLAGLQQIKQKQSTASKQQYTQALNDFNSACADDAAALGFYSQAIDVTRFIGRQDAAAAFETWKKEVLPRMNPDAVRTALWYTSITLQRAGGATDAQIYPVVLAYAEATRPILPTLLAPMVRPGTPPNEPGRRGERPDRQEREELQGMGFGGGDPGERIMEEDVSQNVFSTWYNLGTQLSGLDNWEMVPANIDAIYEKFLLPIMRKNRDPRILDYWDNKILSARGVASDATAAFSTDTYNQTTRPSLLWNRAEDEIVIGRRDQGLKDMYDLVKAFPAHPDAAKWIAELQGLLTAPPAVAAGGTAPAAPQ